MLNDGNEPVAAARVITAIDPASPGTDTTHTVYIESKPATKAIWHSRTFWVNIVALVIGVLGILTQSELFSQYGEQLVMLLAVCNLVLRFLTSTAIDFATSIQNTRAD
jgi:hypothetical protein